MSAGNLIAVISADLLDILCSRNGVWTLEECCKLSQRVSGGGQSPLGQGISFMGYESTRSSAREILIREELMAKTEKKD